MDNSLCLDSHSTIVLTDRAQIDHLVGRTLTDLEWDKVREWITTDDNMWEVIEECLGITLRNLDI